MLYSVNFYAVLVLYAAMPISFWCGSISINQTINLWAYVTRGHCLALVIQIFMVPITLQVSDGQNRFIYGQSCVQESE